MSKISYAGLIASKIEGKPPMAILSEDAVIYGDIVKAGVYVLRADECSYDYYTTEEAVYQWTPVKLPSTCTTARPAAILASVSAKIRNIRRFAAPVKIGTERRNNA